MYLRILTLLGVMLAVSSAWSHARLQSPVPRSNNAGIKSPAPCGPYVKAANAPATNVYTQGQRIMLRFEETIDHPGRYLFTLSNGNNDVFPVTPNLIVPDIQGGALPHQYTAELQLPPAFSCDNCTLQMIQSMEENPAVPSYYYSCADIRIQGPAGSAPTIATIAAQTSQVNIPLSVPLSVADADSVLTCTSTHFSGSSANPLLVRNANITFSGAWPNCRVDVRPEANIVGTTSITVTVTDGVSSSSQSFIYTTIVGTPPPGGGGSLGGSISPSAEVQKPGFGCGLVSDISSGSGPGNGPGASSGAMRWALVLLMLPLVALSALRRRARVSVQSFRRK